MNKGEVINSISERFGISKIEASDFFNSLTEIFHKSFKKGKNINIAGFGKFSVYTKYIEEGKRGKFIAFSPVKKIADEVNEDFNDLFATTVALLNDRSRFGFAGIEEVDPDNDAIIVFDDSELILANEGAETVIEDKSKYVILSDNSHTAESGYESAEVTQDKETTGILEGYGIPREINKREIVEDEIEIPEHNLGKMFAENDEPDNDTVLDTQLTEDETGYTDIVLPEDLKTLHDEIDDQITEQEQETSEQKNVAPTYDDVFEQKNLTTTEGIKVRGRNDKKLKEVSKVDESKEDSRIFSPFVIILIITVIVLFALTYAILKYELIGNTEQDSETEQTIELTEATDVNENSLHTRELSQGEEEHIAYEEAGVVFIRNQEGVYIQTGSFRQEELAQQNKGRLTGRGFDAFVVESDLGEKGVFHRVRIGKFEDLNSARNFADNNLK